MTIDKLPSGSYRVRMTINGKQQSVTFKHKPTESEVMMKLSEKLSTPIAIKHITFEVAANEYCKVKKNVLSPNTYREYKNTPGRLSKDFISLYIDEIESIHIQNEVNNLALTRKPKTVANYYNYIMAVIRLFIKGYSPDPKVIRPMIIEELPYIPSPEEVKLLLEYAQEESDGMFYIPCMLGTYGLRRGEILALSPKDIKNNVVHINKAMVRDFENNWFIKNWPKTETSVRDVPINADLSKLIHEQGYIYKGHPNSISKFIDRFCKKYNVEHFSLHKLRHYFCSELSAENVDIETAKYFSGHKSDYIYIKYRHAREEKIKQAGSQLDNILFKI